LIKRETPAETEEERRREWKGCLGHTLERNDDSIDKQAQQWRLQGYRGIEHLRRDLEEELWTVGFRYCWRKVEMVARNRAGVDWCGLWPMFCRE